MPSPAIARKEMHDVDRCNRPDPIRLGLQSLYSKCCRRRAVAYGPLNIFGCAFARAPDDELANQTSPIDIIPAAFTETVVRHGP